MPVWHEATRKWVEEGKLVLVGITQEQHPDRCRLFSQWHQFDWPILHDPINSMQSRAVPILVAIDEHGIVRDVRPDLESFEEEFINRQFDPPDSSPPVRETTAGPDLAKLARRAEAEQTAAAWQQLGDGLVLWGGSGRINQAIDAYQRALQMQADESGLLHFRLGVCFRMRHESSQRAPGDFQAAVENWSKALAADPNQYIWRRRIQQYGPRLDKPYPFYDWVDQAVADVRTRGEEPVQLAVQPSGAEIAHPARYFQPDDAEVQSPDAKGRIDRDEQGLIDADVAVVPPQIRAGGSARVHVELRPRQSAHWNNEAEPLQLWVDVPDRWQIQRQLLSAPQGDQPETREVRQLEFEVRAPERAHGKVIFPAYALYYVCEEAGGTCLYLRKDLEIELEVAERSQ